MLKNQKNDCFGFFVVEKKKAFSFDVNCNLRKEGRYTIFFSFVLKGL